MAFLPPSLSERIRCPNNTRPLYSVLNDDASSPSSSSSSSPTTHVLYLVRTCLREETNPALEVALRAAAALDLPLICLAVVEDTFPEAMRRGSNSDRRPTDRRAAFVLEALQEMQPAFVRRGTQLLVHVERDGCRPAAALSLAARAATDAWGSMS